MYKAPNEALPGGLTVYTVMHRSDVKLTVVLLARIRKSFDVIKRVFNMKRRRVLTAGTTALASCFGVGLLDRSVFSKEWHRNKPMKMHVGTQRGPTTVKMLQYIKRHGVNHICGYPPHPGDRGYWTVDDLEKTRELCENRGIILDMVALPFLTSSHIDRENAEPSCWAKAQNETVILSTSTS